MAKFDKVKGLTDLRVRSKFPLFMVIEGNYYLHRALHTTPPFTNSKGIPTGALFRALDMICSDYSLLRPKYVCVSFDVPGLNFRHNIFPEYKFNDPLDPANTELGIQLLILVRLLRLIGIPVIFLQGVESDDVVGALAVQAQEGLLGEEVNVVIQTGDKDINQFVTGRCVTCDTKDTGGVNTVARVQERFGVKPSQVADYLALMGDSNDNVPGVANIGPQKARGLLSEFGSIEAILKLKPGKHGKWSPLLNAKALVDLRMSYALTRIRTDVNVERYLPFRLRPAHVRYLTEALNALEFKRVPDLVSNQINKAMLSQSPGLFDDTGEDVAPLVEDSSEWDNLMGCLWKHVDVAYDVAEFK